ncbi:riboflavin synthase subunit alpha [Bacillus spizizenii ATCC 6633 = JCM 2499]|uniref:Riboflavin synthase n=1 Tax=Bacillus spizizenii (strain ATCC 23059 / NRRL B-14472 / W23) TaxID=655816 RepID=E0U200_BACSH|nr:riboflavin synthase subunit alpha [Bacillus spizizenii]QCJ17486.1 riboflavin synthase subunit alpha [Bacillus subtilis]ADM38326.1 riboflavin synthase subunit alpha [Bacillus spizizenii str. W23]AJW83910.1 riboflavin synthase subunit alpha [Bacillus spizizenii]EFG91462.1 riboflavin synthase subunit alpha [Bacillus spizizenii ATCC 6633 = JCM 2499]KFK78045.1 riboflavin synthase, alpha subunit [Bacillus spizizenii]
MFTGIIEETGTIESMKKAGHSMALTIKCSKILEDVHLGDSIAVNGICLTVTDFTKNQFTVDVMPETVKATSLNDLSKGSKVNLERAMAANGRFGGHFVSGHVDGTAEITRIEERSNAVYYDVKMDPSLTKTLVLKGSITVDGVSLTIFGLTEDTVTISLIPHTISETTFSEKTIGSKVNIECDMIGKYMYRFLHKANENKTQQTITKAFLSENGF